MKKRQLKKENNKLESKQKYIGYIPNPLNQFSIDFNYMKYYDYNKEQNAKLFMLPHEEFKHYPKKLFRKIITGKIIKKLGWYYTNKICLCPEHNKNK